MQNILNTSSGSILRARMNYLSCLHHHLMKNNRGNVQHCINHNHIARLFGTLPHKTLRHLHRECKAVNSLLIRSGLVKLPNLNQISISRHFTTSCMKLQQTPNEPSSDSNKNSKKNDNDKKAAMIKLSILTMISYVVLLSLLYSVPSKDGGKNEESPRFVSWNEFVHQMLVKGEVKQLVVRPELEMVTIVLHDGAIIKGKKSPFRTYSLVLPNASALEEKVRETERTLGIKPENGVPIVYERINNDLAQLVITIGLTVLFFAVMSKIFGSTAKIPTNMFSQMTQAKFTLVDPLTGVGKGVRFTDVAGLQEAKVEVMEFVDYLKSPDRYRTLGAKVPKGALLLGPPGCGKTLLAKALATEANVPFLSMNGSEFIEMIGGLGAARVRDLFKQAKKRAPSIIYIDEIDAIGKNRSDAGVNKSDSESEQTLNQLLTEMDGMSSSQEVIVLASTNRAEVLDKALLRPGRFDRHILIDLPTLSERKEIFEQHMKKITLEHSPSTYSSRLAYLSPGCSGADIANVCNEAALHAARVNKTKVTGEDLLYAIDRMIAGIEKRENTIAPSEKRTIAYHEAGHALVGWMLEHTDALLKVTIVPRTSKVLGFAQFTPTDQKLYTTEQLFERMCMALGGRVAESLTFNRITTGAQNDLERVTKMAYAQVQQYGMDEVIGPISFFPEQLDTSNTRKPFSKKLSNMMDLEARNIITRAYKRTEQLLIENSDKLKLLAESLILKETLTCEEIEKLIGPPPFGKKNLVEPADFESSIETSSPTPPEQESSPQQPAPA
ncbi:hypothetical protein QAD02_023314 [Eretmocerus hayati]|uniref:Uncharacterized protein n=1 Tax=Eretmocerus hayati TaxID=131215 RepID=A0ACC2PVA3_9HYME|nr:hypothetical protein QAD02_023314 [Eretmocerus hayati]